LGTLIGAGGGFILVPVLLLLYPHMAPEAVTAISLTAVFFNALSGSFAYSRMKRIDYKSGLLFAAAAVPGSLIGAWTTKFLPRGAFDLLFGSVLVLLATYLALRTFRVPSKDEAPHEQSRLPLFKMLRTVVDWEHIQYVFSYNPILGVVVSVFIGFLSSLLGIGGGIFHVPLLATALNFPVHIATATSHFVLAIMTLSGTLVHIADGGWWHSLNIIVPLALGVLGGAQWGARLSNRVQGTLIIRVLSGTLVLVGIRLVYSSFS